VVVAAILFAFAIKLGVQGLDAQAIFVLIVGGLIALVAIGDLPRNRGLVLLLLCLCVGLAGELISGSFWTLGGLVALLALIMAPAVVAYIAEDSALQKSAFRPVRPEVDLDKSTTDETSLERGGIYNSDDCADYDYLVFEEDGGEREYECECDGRCSDDCEARKLRQLRNSRAE
jgi:hypothetical protein